MSEIFADKYDWMHIIPQKKRYLWNPKFGTTYKVSVHYTNEEKSNFMDIDAVYLNTREGKHMFYFFDSMNFQIRKALSEIDSDPFWIKGPDGRNQPYFRAEIVEEIDMRIGEEKWVKKELGKLKKLR